MDPKEELLATETFYLLPKRTALALWRGGLHSVDRLMRANDDDLMELSGIDVGSIRTIRAAYPAGSGEGESEA